MSIIRQIKNKFDSIRNEQLKINFLQAVPFWAGSVITGLIAVFYARLFGWAEKGTVYVFSHIPWLLFILTPVCFIASWWIVKKASPYARGSGIPQVMAAIELSNPRNNDKINKLLSIRIIIVKIISSLVMVLGGGVIGREGPTIQVAGSVFRKIYQWLPDWWPRISKKNMIMTGAAAGLAAAFNTPLGGIVFAVEELTKTHINYFKTALFTAVIISGLVAQAMLGPYLYLGYPDINNLSSWIFLAAAAVAVVAGLSGSAMARIILKIFNWKAGFKHSYQNILYLIVTGLLIASIAFFIDKSVLGSGKELMTRTLFTSDKEVSWYSAFFRSLGPVLTFTSGAAGGVFAPSLSAGAGIGSLIAGWFHFSDSNTNLLILCGMVAFLAGVTRSPFTSAILVLEMTDRHGVIFHLMMAGMLGSLVGMIVDKHSFYDHLKHQYVDELQKETAMPAEHLNAT